MYALGHQFLQGNLQLAFGGRYQVQQQVWLQILSCLMELYVHWFKTSLQTSSKKIKNEENLASHGSGTLTFWFPAWQCFHAVSLNLFHFKDLMIQFMSMDRMWTWNKPSWSQICQESPLAPAKSMVMRAHAAGSSVELKAPCSAGSASLDRKIETVIFHGAFSIFHDVSR